MIFKNYVNEDHSEIDFLSWGHHSMYDIPFEPRWPGKLVSEEISELAPPGGEICLLIWRVDEKTPFCCGFFRNFSISFACSLMKLDVHVQTNIVQTPTSSVNKDPLFPHIIIHSISEKHLKIRTPKRNFKIVQMFSILYLPALNRPREIKQC